MYRNRKNANALYVAPEQLMPCMQLHRYKQDGAQIGAQFHLQTQNHSFLLLKDKTQYNRDPKIQGRFLAHCHSLSFHFNVRVFHFHQYLGQKKFSNSFLSDVDL